MTDDQIASFQTYALVCATLGVTELALGFWQARAASANRGVGYFLQTAGAGFLIAAPVFYWAWDYYQALIAGLVVIAIGCNLGVLRLLRFMKAKTEGQTS